MATRAQKIRLAVFLIISAVIFSMFFFILVGGKYLKRNETYYIIYRDISITGLEPGAAVKLNGVPVGRVTGLSVETAASVRIEVEVAPNTPIKTDTEAVLNFIGVTGLKYVELISGTEGSAVLPPGGTIKAGQSLIDALSGQASVIVTKLELAINNLNRITGPENNIAFNHALNSFAGVSAQLDTLFQFTRPDIVHALIVMDSVMIQLSETAHKTDYAVESLDDILKTGDIQQTFSNTRHITDTMSTQIDSLNIVELTSDLHLLVENANTMVTHYDLLVLRGRDDILKALRNMEESLDNLRETTDLIRENPSVLIRGRPTANETP
jgi:phospholipid/cholesterol/gamma-HCH transport system substrate-binding protein